jgi:Tfp pilus assembly protein PilF
MTVGFISYRRVPSFTLADSIYTKLKYQFQIDTYLDVTRVDSAHVQFPDRLFTAIRESPLFICVIGQGTLDSEWVLKEIRYAYELQKPCIPIFHEDYQPVSSDDPAISYLLSFDAVHFMDRRGILVAGSMSELVQLIRNTVCQPTPVLEPVAVSVEPVNVSSITQHYLREAQQAFTNGNYKFAVSAYDEAIALSPDSVLAFNSRGLAHYFLRSYRQAIDDYNEAIRLDPYFHDAYIGRGLAYYELERFERAIIDYNHAINQNPNNAIVFNNRGLAYYAMKDFDYAIGDYGEAIRLDPKYSIAYNNRGLTYSGMKEYYQAIENYSQAILFNPRYRNAYYNRGYAHERTGDYRQALRDYQNALNIDPSYWLARHNYERLSSQLHH